MSWGGLHCRFTAGRFLALISAGFLSFGCFMSYPSLPVWIFSRYPIIQKTLYFWFAGVQKKASPDKNRAVEAASPCQIAIIFALHLRPFSEVKISLMTLTGNHRTQCKTEQRCLFSQWVSSSTASEGGFLFLFFVSSNTQIYTKKELLSLVSLSAVKDLRCFAQGHIVIDS